MDITADHSGVRVAVVDRDAGAEVGHHRHWLERLLVQLSESDTVVVVTSAVPTAQTMAGNHRTHVLRVPECASRTAWYRRAIEVAQAQYPTSLILLSGDDALLALVAASGALRRSGIKDIRVLLFRLSKQPRVFARATLAGKIAAIMTTRLCVPSAKYFVLELPFKPRKGIASLIARTVADSSAGEVMDPVGKTRARSALELPTSGQIVSVLGMLSAGKHVDTILAAWPSIRRPGRALVFLGEADRETDLLLRAAAAKWPDDVIYRTGRLSDGDFDLAIEAADVVCTLYRYSASSGVVLRSLALGTKIVAGGSYSLNRNLACIPGVWLVRKPRAGAVAAKVRAALDAPALQPKAHRELELEFPGPLIAGLA